MLSLQSFYGNSYNTTTIKLSLITIYEKYCNSKKGLCDDIKELLSSACMSSLLVYFIENNQLSKLQKLKEYRLMYYILKAFNYGTCLVW